MGTHPKAPARILSPNIPDQLLSDWVSANLWALGDNVAKRFNKEMPFLFKVLSVNNALSIQAHPTKELAERLHAQDPEHYLDPNHKPEMALALTPFEGLCGFRPVKETAAFIKSVPELKVVIGGQPADKLVAQVESNSEKEVVAALKECFTHLMHCPSDVIQAQLQQLVSRLENHPNGKTPHLLSIILCGMVSRPLVYYKLTLEGTLKHLAVVIVTRSEFM